MNASHVDRDVRREQMIGPLLIVLFAVFVAAFFFFNSPFLFPVQRNVGCTITDVVPATADSKIVIMLDCKGAVAQTTTNASAAIAFLKDPAKNKLTCNVARSGEALCQ